MRLTALILLSACSADGGDVPVDTSRPRAPWPAAEQEVFALSGEITWSVDFDEAAEQAGKRDCSYTRRYTATEDRSRPWSCRSCALMLRAEVEMVAGLDDCYAQVTEAEPAAVEWVGYGSGSWWRSTRENRPLGASATATVSNGDLSLVQQVESRSFDEHALVFSIAGTLEGSTAMADPLDGLQPPETSSCGWDRTVVEVYDGSTRMSLGGRVPDAYLPDACGEGVRIHQFTGEYLVLAWVAEGEAASEAWLDAARSEVDGLGYPTEVVSLASLSADSRWDSPSSEDLARIAEGRGLAVLGHRGFGDTVMADADSFVWPVVAVAAPDREILLLDRQGFSGWDAVAEAIEDHANRL